MTTPWSDWHNQPVIKITPGGVELTAVVLRDLKLINPTVPTAPISGNYGVQCDVPSDGSKVSGSVPTTRESWGQLKSKYAR